MKTNRIKTKAAVSDVLFYYAGQRNDRCIRTRLQLDGELDLDILIQALNKSIELLPVLKSKWIDGKVYYHWELLQKFDIIDYITVTNDFAEAENFLIEKIDCEKGPQIRVLIYRNNGKDTLQITITHLCVDGTAFKHFYILLSKYYNGLKHDKNFVLKDFVDNNRDLWQIFKKFSLKQRIKFLFGSDKPRGQNHLKCIDFDDESVERRKTFIKNTIDGNVLQKLISKSKKAGLTVNDVFMASLTKVFFDISNVDPSPLNTYCAFNLRNYLKDMKKLDFTNKVAEVCITINKIEGESFDEFVSRVGEQIKMKKNNYYSLFKQELLRIIPLILSIPALKKVITKLYTDFDKLGISNIGIVSNDLFKFDNLNIEDFFLNGAIRTNLIPNIFICTVNNHHINVNCAICGSEKEINQIKKVIEMLVLNIKKYVE